MCAQVDYLKQKHDVFASFLCESFLNINLLSIVKVTIIWCNMSFQYNANLGIPQFKHVIVVLYLRVLNVDNLNLSKTFMVDSN